MQLILTPELMIEAYRHGLFPMAYNSGSPYVHWVCPDMRGQLSIPELHIPRKLEKTIRRAPYKVTIDQVFEDVIAHCAEPSPNRPETWINEAIMKVFIDLHHRGDAHSVECWDGETLVGGLYGLRIGGVFFGESMFSRASDASKIALIHLVARLWKGGFTMLDTQFVNEHLEQFGVFEVTHKDYKQKLDMALQEEADFMLEGLSEAEIIEAYLLSRNG